MKVTTKASHPCDAAAAAPSPAEALFLSDVEELRECLRRSQMKCDSLERERDYHIAKAKELSTMLEVRIETATNNNNKDAAPSKRQQQELIFKTVEVAELNHEKDLLRFELSKSNQRIQELEMDCQTNRSVLLELSQIFRSVTMGTGGHQDVLHQMEALRNQEMAENSKEADADDGDNKHMVVDHILSPQQAFDLTLSTLREQVESLEDERERYIGRIRTLQNYLEEQRRENEARELKIVALEKQMEEFWSENSALKEFLDHSLDVLQVEDEKDTTTTAADAANRNLKKRLNVVAKANNNNNKKTGRAGKLMGWRRRKEVV
jgi:hypothetical protein